MTETTKKLNAYEQRMRLDAEARERDAKHQAGIRERAEATVASAKKAEAEQERQQAIDNEAAFRAEELRKYLNAGGTSAEFDSAWPRLRQQIVERAYLEGRTLAPTSETAAAAKRYLDLSYKRDG